MHTVLYDYCMRVIIRLVGLLVAVVICLELTWRLRLRVMAMHKGRGGGAHRGGVVNPLKIITKLQMNYKL